jgi:hypothetical protein
MAKYNLNRKQLQEHIEAVLAEALYDNDMSNLAKTTGETMDDDFLDSVAYYDNINNGPEGPVYADRKAEEMSSDWREIDDQAADTQAKYGKNADELDKLNAFSDTIDQYVNDTNLNGYEDNSGFMAMRDYDDARAEAEHPMESIIRKMVKEALSTVHVGDYDKPNHPDDFSNNYRTNAHKFAHDGVDAYFARKDQDKMHKKEKDNMKRADKRAMAAADKRPLHRKGSLNRAFESKIRNMVKEALNEYSDDDAFWKQQQDDEMSYDMRELTKAMQQANGTYHAKSSDGQFQTGDKVIVHGRTQNIEGVIKDFGTHLMTWEETCDVDYEKDGKTWTLLSVPLNKIEKVTANEGKIHEEIDTGQVRSSQDNEDSKRHRLKRDEANKEINRQIRKLRQQISDYEDDGKDTTPLTNKIKSLKKQLKESWYPEEDDDLSDYSYGAIMKLNVDGMFDELTPEKVQELQSVKDEYIDNSNNYSSVLVRQILLQPDGFDGYDVSVEVAVSSPDMPMDAIEEEVESMVWYYIEEKTGVRSPRVYIVDEKEVFDRRSKNR